MYLYNVHHMCKNMLPNVLYRIVYIYIIRYIFQLFSTSTLSRASPPLEDVQLLEKAVAGLERSVEKDFQALPCNSWKQHAKRSRRCLVYQIYISWHEGTVYFCNLFESYIEPFHKSLVISEKSWYVSVRNFFLGGWLGSFDSALVFSTFVPFNGWTWLDESYIHM